MKFLPTSLVALSFLVGCTGTTNPITGGDEPEEQVVDAGPPEPDLETIGTEDASEAIERYEQLNDKGGGYARAMSYNSATDTFSVDNLGFDGANVYARGALLSDLGPFQVFDGPDVAFDSLTGAPIDQFLHRAVFGESTSGEARFAIARTGQYVGYGFGGFMYARDGNVTIPTTGQAAFNGDYAGIRVFSDQTGIEFTEGDMFVAIDFRDFNDGNAVQGSVFNRVAYDDNGDPLTLGATQYDEEVFLPQLNFTVGPGVMASNGILEGELTSQAVDRDGALETFEAGKYYGILSGTNVSELVGVFVVESLDPRIVDAAGNPCCVTIQETGGFVLYR